MSDLQITSASNPRLKSLVALRRRRARDEQGLTVVEGLEELTLAVTAGVVPREVYHCPDLAGQASAATELVEQVRAAGAQVVQVGRTAFEKVSYREGPDGLLGVVEVPGVGLDDLVVREGALVLLAEGVEKPGNLGAMLRTADAAGVDAVIAVDPVSDWGNPNVIRSSKGTVFSVPVASATRDETLAWLANHGIAVIAATPEAREDYTEVDLQSGVAIAVGTEKHGLTEELMAAATHRVRIPMAGRADSLNVSISAALLLYEAVRQRRS